MTEITQDMVDRGVAALPGWHVWEVTNRRMHECDEEFVRAILVAAHGTNAPKET